VWNTGPSPLESLIVFEMKVDSANAAVLIELASRLDVELLDRLIEMNCGINSRVTSGEETLLHFFVIEKRIDAVRWLGELGADPDMSDRYGSFPVHSAALVNNTEMILLLWEMGARLNVMDNCRMTPIGIAAQMGHYSLFLLLAGIMNAHEIQMHVPFYLLEKMVGQKDLCIASAFAQGAIAESKSAKHRDG
jgi:ankyrin repeat protein